MLAQRSSTSTLSPLNESSLAFTKSLRIRHLWLREKLHTSQRARKKVYRDGGEIEQQGYTQVPNASGCFIGLSVLQRYEELGQKSGQPSRPEGHSRPYPRLYIPPTAPQQHFAITNYFTTKRTSRARSRGYLYTLLPEQFL
uniref:Uncharacterized protein n=1 Tax=Trichogramma kaykai TaxID=54128 RepID=A0ABD2WCI2_9HYME